jgi:hypothetical protein
MSGLHDDFPPHAQAREEAMLFEKAKARAELRDRFAMAVVSGVYIHWRTSLDTMELGCDYEDIAMMAYDVADAMLKARGHE